MLIPCPGTALWRQWPKAELIQSRVEINETSLGLEKRLSFFFRIIFTVQRCQSMQGQPCKGNEHAQTKAWVRNNPLPSGLRVRTVIYLGGALVRLGLVTSERMVSLYQHAPTPSSQRRDGRQEKE